MWRRYLDLPRAVHALCLGAFINRAGAMVLPFLVLYLTEARHFSPAGAARILAAFGVGGVISAVVGGMLADRIGRRPVMIGALLGAAITIQLIPRIEGEVGVLCAVLGFALASEAYRPAGSAMLGDLTVPELRPRAYALFYVAINMGFTVGAAVGGWLVVATSYDTLFTVESVSAVVYAVFVLLLLPESRPRGAPSTAPDAGAAMDAEPTPVLGRWGALGHVLGNRPFMVFTTASLMIGIVFNQSFSSLPLYMERAGITPDIYGRVMAVNGVMIVIGQMPLADRLSQVNRATALIVGALLLGLGFGLKAATATAIGLTGCVVLWTIGEMFLASLSHPVVNDLAPAALRARYFGAFTLSFALAMAVGPPFGAWLLARHGAVVLWLTAGGLAWGAAFLMWTIRGSLVRTDAGLVVGQPIGPAPPPPVSGPPAEPVLRA